MAKNNSGGPNPEEVEHLTNVICETLGNVDLESILTVLCNLLGQLVCTLADGKPSGIQTHGDCIAENVKKAAIAKMFYDDDKRRREQNDD